MRVAYLGPEGTFSEQALLASPDAQTTAIEPIAFASIHDATQAVATGDVERALVPIENSLEGSVNATLDALTARGSALRIVGETVLAVTQCLIVRDGVGLDEIEVVTSHPQPLAQCARFLHERLPRARTMLAASTAEAARSVAATSEPWAAIGPRRAAELSGTVVLREAIEDDPSNATRFVWLAAGDAATGPAGEARAGSGKTSVLFAGVGDESPGWLVRCLTELSSRAVNMTKIESRPSRERLGHYLFLIDVEGRVGERAIDEAIAGLRAHCQDVRVLGSYSAATDGPVD